MKMNKLFIAGAVGLAAVLIGLKAKAVGNGNGGNGGNGEIHATISFDREAECLTSQGDSCLEYSDDERIGTITIQNTGAPARLTTRLAGWIYLDDGPHSELMHKEWTTDFVIGSPSSVSYSFNYMVPISGMNLDSRFFITVEDEAGNFVASEAFIKSL